MHKSSTIIFTPVGRAIDRLSQVNNYLAGLFLLVMTFILGYEVISRRFFDSPTIWVYPLTAFAFMWFPLLASACAFKEDAHVRCDILINYLPEETKNILAIAADIVSLIFILALFYSGILAVKSQYQFGATVMGLVSYPKWILYMSIPVGAAFCLIQVIRNMVKRYNSIAGRSFFRSGLSLSSPSVILIIFFSLCLISGYLLKINPAAGIILLTIVLILSGVPIAFGLGTVGCIAIITIHQGDLSSLRPLTIITGHTFGSITLVAIPLFVLGGYILNSGQLGERLYDFVGKWLSFLPGSLGVATVITGGLLAAMIGSSTAVTAIIAVVAVKPLLEANYSKYLTYGTVAGTSLGIIIPPSVGFVLYGYLTDTSVGKLFMAGLVPGILLIVLFAVYIIIACIAQGIRSNDNVTWKDRYVSLKKTVFILFIPAVVLGGIYQGVMTPTEAAAILVLLSILGIIIHHEFTWSRFKEALHKGTLAATMILFIMLGAMTVTHVLAYLQIPRSLAEFIVSARQPVYVIIIALFVMYLILGMFLEGSSMVALTVPVIAPVASGIGLDLITFGVILMLMIEIALLTPPVGLNLFVVKGILDEPLGPIIKGTFPYLLIILSVAILIFLFPNVALWLPIKMAY